ncbi:MAG: hypothetical protein RLP97_27425 [Coleofasciculus chthonoplastes F2-STO-03]
MNIKELEPQLLALKPTEKAQAIHLLAQSFDNNWKGNSLFDRTKKID